MVLPVLMDCLLAWEAKGLGIFIVIEIINRVKYTGKELPINFSNIAKSLGIEANKVQKRMNL